MDQELALLVFGQGMDGDPLDGRSFRKTDDPLVQLGMRLFFSKSLGGERDSACVTCHHPLLGGGDNLSLSIGVEATVPDKLGPGRTHSAAAGDFDGGPTVPRNAPTTFNLGLWKKVLFHDGRVESLMQPVGQPPLIRTPDSAFGTQDVQAGESLAIAQARFPVTSPEEMKGHLKGALSNQQIRTLLAERLGGSGSEAGVLPNPGYWLAKFRVAFENPGGTAAELITFGNITRALAAYQESQVLVSNRWQNFLAGNTQGLTSAEKRGALLFFRPRAQGGKGCVSCHAGDFFTKEEFFTLGVPQLGRGKGNGATGREDFGRARETSAAGDMYAFRVPSLLNVEVTGPWGHSGAYTSLEAMVGHYRDPDGAAASYNAGQLTQPGIQNLATVAADTVGAANKIVADRAAGRRSIPDTPLTNTEINELVAFLKTLTDPCAKDPNCMQKWIPDFTNDADPNGDQLNFSP